MGELAGVAEMVIRVIDWPSIQEARGDARGVGVALSDLLSSRSPEAASLAYWRLENRVVVQGELFEAAEACVTVLVAAFANERPRHLRICALDLLFQILGGSPSAMPSTPPDILERCQRAVREGVWGLVREAVVGERDAAWEVLEQAALGVRLESLHAEVVRARAQLDITSQPEPAGDAG